MSLCKPKRKIKPPSCVAGLLCFCDFYTEGQSSLHACKTIPWKGGKSDTGRNVYFCGEYSPGGAAVHVSKGSLESGSIWGSLGERTALFGSGGLFVCCLRVSPEYGMSRLLIVGWLSGALTFSEYLIGYLGMSSLESSLIFLNPILLYYQWS